MPVKNIKPTNVNLKKHAVTPLASWLIQVAETRDVLTYGEAKLRVEQEHNFSTIFSPKMGFPAGEVMNRILEEYPDAPLLNVLLVKQEDKMPGDGAGWYLSNHFKKPFLAVKGARKKHRKLWKECFEEAAEEVYAYDEWPKVFKKVFGTTYHPRTPLDETGADPPEKDGLPRWGRAGEGPNHKALRLWVMNNPDKVRPKARGVRAQTEVDLLSGDRVDVVYYCEDRTITLEVKSSDSNYDDLKRGIYQCIKHREVQKAMDARSEAPVEAVLVTEEDLPGYLKSLVKLHKIIHVKAPAKGKR